MFAYRLFLVTLSCLFGGCQQETPSHDFGEVIYEIPVLPDEDPADEDASQK